MTNHRAIEATPARFIRSALTLGILLALPLLGACATTDRAAPRAEVVAEPVTPEMLANAQATLAAGRVSDALQRYQQIVALDPKNGEGQLGLGESYLALRQTSAAVDAFEAVIDRPEQRTRALLGLGLAALAQGQSVDAKAMLTEVVAADPMSWRAWNALGLIADTERRWDDAREAYEKALATTTLPALIHNNLGFSLLLQKRHAPAAEEFRAALQLEPRLDAARNNLRLALAWQGRYAEALAAAPREAKPSVLNNVGYVAMMRRDYAAAQSYFSQAMEQSPSYYATAAQNLLQLKAVTGETDTTPRP
jgi:Flp pilus assembly protein TadD